MGTNSFIMERINDLSQQFKNAKDGNRSLVAALANEFNQYNPHLKHHIIHFFIREIQLNEHGMRSLALSIIEDMEAIEAAPYIYKIYLKYLKNEDEKWEKEIITILLKLRFAKPQKFYSNYINKCLNKIPDNGYIYFLGVLYCNVNPTDGLDLLSSYFCKHLSEPNEKMTLFFENRMGFLYHYFSKNSIDYIPELIKITTNKSKVSGLMLKEIMLKYLNSNLVGDYDEEIVKSRINTLININL